MSMSQTPTVDPATASPLYVLVALKLAAAGAEQTDPRQFIRARREAETPTPWRTIANEIRDLTDVKVNHQTLVNWSGLSAT